ncbi:MAG: glucose-1-phosphate adenylyltransferase subunit GlgD [Anaerovoracaceae bacterium]|jgi:glucose-1-phosphate adenylyltransferase
MNAAGMIFVDSYDVNLDELTYKRNLASVPFGARYRVIDFVLSNMVNADMRNIGIVTTQKYKSLMGHVGAGTEWDLNRKQSGVTFLPPFSSENARSVYENSLEAMQANMSYLRNVKEEYILFTGCSSIGNIDFQKMYDYHVKSGAMITGLYTDEPLHKQPDVPFTEFEIDPTGRVTDLHVTTGGAKGKHVATNTYLMAKDDLLKILKKTVEDKKTSFRLDVLLPLIRYEKVMAYKAEEKLMFLDDISAYLQSSLELLKADVRYELFKNTERPIITRVKDSPPGSYGSEAEVTNSLIAAGTTINGTVRNSIIFREVRIEKGAVVENSVVMQDTVVGEGARLNYAILDKRVRINNGRHLSGYVTHPFFVRGKTSI